MCGICGFNWDNKILLNKILNEIKHRGPDDKGTFIDKNLSLGHRRLSIIDLSKQGKQPLSNEDNTLWITFNGEIYNFKELKKELEKKGHIFKSNTDTEVIVHLYEEEGINCITKLNGMFAFAIYDSKNQILFLARDRAGIKPLYYFANSIGKFIFCSEIKGILQDTSIRREVNLNGVSSFLTFRANILEETCFKGIRKLLPGHFLIYDLKRKKVIKKQIYWDVPKKEEEKSESFFLNKINSLLKDSIKIRLMSDVPFGAYLSGGVDSGSIVSIMKDYTDKPVETFSVGFDQSDYNELEESRFLADKLETNHHELVINGNSIKYLPSIVHHLDEPMADPTSLPIYLLSQYTKKYCTVILTGEGADELFAGYPQYKFMNIHKRFTSLLPKILKETIFNTVKNLPKSYLNNLFKFSSELGEKGLERFHNFILSKEISNQYLEQISIFNTLEKRELLLEKTFLLNNQEIQNKEYLESPLKLNNLLRFDFKGNMVDDLLMKLDKNTMAFAIEGRVPFLDYRLVEFAYKMLFNLKLKFFHKDKYIFRKAIKNKLPNETRTRKKKHFFVPINHWFNNELINVKEELLSKRFIEKQKIFDYNYIHKINNNFNKSKLFYSRQLWSLINFQIWYKQYIENEKIKI